MKLINYLENKKNISSVDNWKNLTYGGKQIKSVIKQFVLMITPIFILIFIAACANSNNQEIDQIKKDLEAYKSQVDVLKSRK